MWSGMRGEMLRKADPIIEEACKVRCGRFGVLENGRNQGYSSVEFEKVAHG